MVLAPHDEKVLTSGRGLGEQVGASSLKEMSKRTTFIRVTQQLNPVFAGAEKS